MVKITGEYQGDLHCTATHGPSGRTLETDAPVDNQGRGETFSPTDLAATALATCMLTIMGMAARRLGLDLKGARFEVTKEMSADLPGASCGWKRRSGCRCRGAPIRPASWNAPRKRVRCTRACIRRSTSRWRCTGKNRRGGESPASRLPTGRTTPRCLFFAGEPVGGVEDEFDLLAHPHPDFDLAVIAPGGIRHRAPLDAAFGAAAVAGMAL